MRSGNVEKSRSVEDCTVENYGCRLWREAGGNAVFGQGMNKVRYLILPHSWTSGKI